MSASSRSRRMTARKSSSSLLLALWTWTLPSACSFFQLIQRTRNGDQLTFEHGIKKAILTLPLGEQLAYRIPRYIHLAPESPFEPPQRRNKLLHSNSTNNQQIDIARSSLLSTRNGAIKRRPLNLPDESFKLGLEGGNYSRRFRKQRAQLAKYRSGLVSSVVSPPPIPHAFQNPASREALHLPLKA